MKIGHGLFPRSIDADLAAWTLEPGAQAAHPPGRPPDGQYRVCPSLKSLHQFLWRAGGRLGVRLHGGAGGDEPLEVRVDGETLRWRLLSLPLYAAEHIPSLSW